MRSSSTLLLALLLPAAAAALALGPPLDPPASPGTPLGPVEIDAPPLAPPPVAAPPLDLVLPDPQPRGERPGDLPDAVPPLGANGPPDGIPPLGANGPPDGIPPLGANGPPDSLPLGEGIPDLSGDVLLPPGAEIVFEVAPPFGGTPGRGRMNPVPEPGTALLLAAGLVALGSRRVRRS